MPIYVSTSEKWVRRCSMTDHIHDSFLWAEHTVGPLRLSAIMLLRLLSFYQVNPHFLDFLYAYASPHAEDRELHFSGFRTEKTLINPVSGTKVPELGRSGRRFQLCYNLKTAAPKPGGNWKIRQAAFHHQFDVGQATQLWIIGDPHAALKDRIGELYCDKNTYDTSFSTLEQAFRSSLETHIAFAQWATSEWRWNVRFLEQGAEDLVRHRQLFILFAFPFPIADNFYIDPISRSDQ